MDSVTQFALGAAVSAALLGRHIGPRRAALIGGVLGTLPDLDAFLPVADPVAAFTGHRGPTHSLLVQAAVTPLFAEALMRLTAGLRGERLRTYAAVYLVFATHALIDAMTIYGTRLLWPLVQGPFGVGSIFIIDPLYTLPLLVAFVWALCIGKWTRPFGRAVAVALAVSSAYMLATVPLQRAVASRAAAWLTGHGITAERLQATPAPFTVLYWRAIAVDGPRYLNLYMPLIGGQDTISAYMHPRHPELADCLDGIEAYGSLAAFAKGLYRLDLADGRLTFSDLRMGLTPGHVFRFALAETTTNGFRRLEPPTREDVVRRTGGDLEWLLAGITQNPVDRPAEAEARIARGDPAPAESHRSAPPTCALGTGARE